MDKYIGITIGPIFKTMSLSSSPVALWASSYIFSLLSKTICKELVEDGVRKSDIVVPYYAENFDYNKMNNGVGLFPDHIIFKADDYAVSNVTAVKNKAIEYVAGQFSVGAEYLEKYVMVSAFEFKANNPILESGKIFDSLELATPFVDKEEINPILALFSGDKYSKNNAIKNTEFVANLNSFQLKKDDNSFKSLDDIVKIGNGYKKYEYYAIVRSDGDNMGKIISGLTDDEKIRTFSQTCLNYCAEVAEKVNEFNGVTIYAGGDDLLAILPCESKNGKTIFSFVKEANEVFAKNFEDYIKLLPEDSKKPSLSFGITIAYHKFPLYEALEDSAGLLFGVAKQGDKNCVAVRLQKHAGQSEGLVIPNDRLNDVINLLNVIKESKKKKENGNASKDVEKKDENVNAEGDDKVFVSALHKLAMFEKAFDGTETDAEVYNLFENIFDGNEHKDSTFLHKTLPEIFVKLKENNNIKAIDNEGVKGNKPSLVLSYVLRILKFFFEKGGEKK